ncbi:MAG: QueG-associated DUF1730 domain-containing protein, partial [Pyrinomonadaceae bacterium]
MNSVVPAEIEAETLPVARHDPAVAARRIKEMALGLGFDLVGIARAEALVDERARLEEWLDRGFHGEMRWMERDPAKRGDPRELLPGARSVVAMALNYFRPEPHGDDVDKGKISRYAWGDDYHDVVGQKLRQLLDAVKAEFPGTEGKVCADI